MDPWLAVAAVGTAAGFLGARIAEQPWLVVFFKPLPVLCLALHQRHAPPASYSGPIAAGLAFSALGDVLLEWPADRFVPGLLAFLTAHVLYTAGFVARARGAALARVVPFAAYGLGMFAFLQPSLGALAVPVGAYVAVICTMAWRASATVGHIPPTAAALALGGACLFVISDSILALDRFHAPVPAASWLVMGTYWAGQLGIALSTTWQTPSRRGS